MYTFRAPALFLLVLPALLTGCSAPQDKLQRTYIPNSKTLTYRQVMIFGFQEPVWLEIKNSSNGVVVQFTGTISTGLHEFALGELARGGDRALFESAYNYLGTIVKSGKATGTADISFDLADYPFDQQGKSNSEAFARFFSSPELTGKMCQLNTFYMNRYWAEGSKCTFQWKYDRKGSPELVKTSSDFWDNDASFAGNPEKVIRMVFEYAQSMTN